MSEGDTRAHTTRPACSLQRSPSCCSTDLQEGGFEGAGGVKSLPPLQELQGC